MVTDSCEDDKDNWKVFFSHRDSEIQTKATNELNREFKIFYI